MAQYDSRYGICTQVYVTCPISPENTYCFYEHKGMGKYPKKDEETVADHPKQIFAIKIDLSKHTSYASRNREDLWPIGKGWLSHRQPLPLIEKLFLYFLREALDAQGFKYELKARGSATRRGKQAWAFYPLEYLVCLEGNGILLKLIGIDNVDKEVWEKVEEYYQAAKTRLEEINAEIQSNIQEETARLQALDDGQTSI